MNNKRLSLMDDLILQVNELRAENAALKTEVASLRIAQQRYAKMPKVQRFVRSCGRLQVFCL